MSNLKCIWKHEHNCFNGTAKYRVCRIKGTNVRKIYQDRQLVSYYKYCPFCGKLLQIDDS